MAHEKIHQRVWCEGDRCRVRWSGDNEVYDAKVKKIICHTRGRRKVLVGFTNFDSEDDEEVELEELIPVNTRRKKQSTGKSTEKSPTSGTQVDIMFSHGLEIDEQERLRKKFEMLEREEEEDEANLKKDRKWRTTSRRLITDINASNGENSKLKKTFSPPSKRTYESEGELEETTYFNNKRSPRKRGCDIMSPKTKHSLSDWFSDFTDSGNEDDKSAVNKSSHAGFEEEDLEKPRFGHKPHSPKVPLVLSPDDMKRPVHVPANINQFLWDYQRDGIRFLYKHYERNGGAILGDDMGLGKTVQVIAFMSAVLGKTCTKEDVFKQKPKFIRLLSSNPGDDDQEEGEKKVFLIIGPASVLYNWVDELETWGHFKIGKFHKNYKEQTKAELKQEKLDAVVTTFETCRDNIKELNSFKWDAVIADEVHKIKGMKAEITQAMKTLKCKRRFGLTGTALQNDMKELWCVLDWANPGCLGTISAFTERFERIILEGQKRDATKRQLAEARKAMEKFSELRNRWFLRRTKTLIADQLPKKLERVVYCRPTPFQLDVYKAVLGHGHIRMILTQHDPCPCNSGFTRGKCHFKKADDGRSMNQLLFSYLHLLLKTANHVALLMPSKTTNENQQKQAEDICEVAFAQHPQFRTQTETAAFRTLSDPKYCGKMKVMAGLLKVFKKEKSKVLVFSLSTQLLDIIEHYVLTTGYEYRRLDGKTPDLRRVQLVREFNRDPGIFLFLASTRAGGIGLNLTGANVVIIYDPNWNPTHDLQAQDRAYRLGQGRDVRVFRLITMGTIEENIYLRQVYKQQLDKVAVNEENAKRLFHREEIFGLENLFKLRTSDSCLTTDILERNEKTETTIRGFRIGNYIRPGGQDTSKLNLRTVEKRGKQKRDDAYGIGYLYSQEVEPTADSEEPSDEDTEAELSSDESHHSDNGDYIKEEQADSLRITDSESSDSLLLGEGEPVGCCDADGKKCSSRTLPYCRECVDPTPGTSKASPAHTCGVGAVAARRSAGSGVKPTRKARRTSNSDQDDPFPCKEEKTSGTERQNSTPGESVIFGSVSDVFNQYGVSHVHENHKLIGASRAEDHMTRCAIQDVFELHQHSQVPAAYCSPLSESSDESDDLGSIPLAQPPNRLSPSVTKQKQPTPRRQSQQTKAVQQKSMVIDRTKVLIGQTPVAIRRRQFRDLVSHSEKANDDVGLATYLLAASREERQRLLEDYYLATDPRLKQVFGTDDHKQETTKGTPSTAEVKETGPRQKRKQKKRKDASRLKGCNFSSDTESEDDEKRGRQNGRDAKQAKDYKSSYPVIKQEHTDSRSIKGTQQDARGNKRADSRFDATNIFSSNKSQSKLHGKDTIRSPRKTVGLEFSSKDGSGRDDSSHCHSQDSKSDLQDFLSDILGASDDEAVVRSAPRTQPPRKKSRVLDHTHKTDEVRNAATSGADVSILDDLFGDSVICKAAPRRTIKHSPAADKREVSELNEQQSLSKKKSMASFGENSLETFERECKKGTPHLHATMDSFCEISDDEDLY